VALGGRGPPPSGHGKPYLPPPYAAQSRAFPFARLGRVIHDPTPPPASPPLAGSLAGGDVSRSVRTVKNDMRNVCLRDRARKPKRNPAMTAARAWFPPPDRNSIFNRPLRSLPAGWSRMLFLVGGEGLCPRRILDKAASFSHCSRQRKCLGIAPAAEGFPSHAGLSRFRQSGPAVVSHAAQSATTFQAKALRLETISHAPVPPSPLSAPSVARHCAQWHVGPHFSVLCGGRRSPPIPSSPSAS